MDPGWERIGKINYEIKIVCWRCWWNGENTDLSRWMHESHIWNTFRRIVTTLHWELAARRQGTRSMSGVSPSVPRTAWELDSTLYTSCITYPRGRAKRIRIVFTARPMGKDLPTHRRARYTCLTCLNKYWTRQSSCPIAEMRIDQFRIVLPWLDTVLSTTDWINCTLSHLRERCVIMLQFAGTRGISSHMLSTVFKCEDSTVL